MRLSWLQCLALAVSAAVAVCAAPASARDLQLGEILCVGGADSARAALELEPQELDCSAVRFAKRDRFVRTHADIAEGFYPTEELLYWQTDPSHFETMLVRFVYEDGTEKLFDVDPQMAARNWFVQTRFSVPVPKLSARLVGVDMVVERARTAQTFQEARLVGRQEAREEHYSKSLLYSLLCGLLLVPIIFGVLSYHWLRFRFIIWHVVMTAGALMFVVSNSGLLFRLLPDAPLGLRFQLNTISLAIATASAVLFVKELIEEGKVPRWLVRTTIGLALFMLVMKTVTVIDLESLRMISQSAFLFSMLPLSLALLALITTALLNNSRVAMYLLFAFSGMILGGIIRLLMGLGLYDPAFHIDNFLYLAMAILVLGTSAAVGDRFVVLRVERDRARVSAIKLGRLAMTDPLTGLGNRRAFESIERVERGQALLVADIDHFKAINDSKGHAVGDAVLRHMASVMRDSFETVSGATIYRLGGEEFAVLFACDDETAMCHAAERLRKAVDRDMPGDSIGLPHATVSVGGAMGRGRDLKQVFSEADQALYAAKQAGRNRSAVSGEDGPDVLANVAKA
ncbi:GGDEF domain-containing protein [Qipengyuania sphaerica]|uniref:GGDEF domain-containing protein n=1 Tax=Qipengyuania sphaerica TaxID=2867243 RepID=UPI001C8680F2|nr:diguanylate cyclase [Qipengyuania sphaerica]MBX7540471.1 GGDEF domain-containing protein [Qipengyuania sphaerica]